MKNSEVSEKNITQIQFNITIIYTAKFTEKKFYVVFNPKIIKSGEETTSLEEGCLSVPGIYGEVQRPDKITVMGFDESGKKIKFKINGLLARVFQHEIDHLNGGLFIDKAKELYKMEKNV